MFVFSIVISVVSFDTVAMSSVPSSQNLEHKHCWMTACGLFSPHTAQGNLSIFTVLNFTAMC